MDKENKIERDILKNAYYMISLFEDKKNEYYKDINNESNSEENKLEQIPNNIIISNLKLQKLMYFVEAYYMNKEDKNHLYDSEWSAWDYGPVNKELYNYFKKFGSVEISLSQEEKNTIDDLPETNKKCIKKIYDFFGGYNAFDLVTLTHMPNSPWYELKRTSKYDFNILNDSVINKKETKIWFKNTFGKILELETQK
jgi:uncharacterized phage-associated protein